MGVKPFLVRFVINARNKNGSIVCDIIKTQTIPIMDIAAIDRKAGCCAKINTPKPAMVVTADKKIDVRIDWKIFLDLLYIPAAIHPW